VTAPAASLGASVTTQAGRIDRGRRAETGARIASLAAELRGAGIPAGVTGQVAGVVRTAGLDAVIDLGAGMLTNEVAGAVLLDALIDARRRGADSAETAAELRTVARLQTVVARLLAGLASSGQHPAAASVDTAVAAGAEPSGTGDRP